MIRNPINFIRISIEIGFFFISYVIFVIASLVRLARDRHDLKHFFLILLLKCCFATTDIAPSSFNSFETLRILINIWCIKFLLNIACKWTFLFSFKILVLRTTLNASNVFRYRNSSCLLIALINPLSSLFLRIFWRWRNLTKSYHALKQSRSILNYVFDL